MYKVELELFEGPIDLLIYLIRKKEVSIYNIPISEITEEFLNYMESMEELNIPLASEFIVMAATLTKIKSEMLIPRDKDYDPRKAIVQAIEEYLRIKHGVEKLEELEETKSNMFSNNTSDIVFQFQDKIKIDNTPEDLKETLLSLTNKETPIPTAININSEQFKVSSKMDILKHMLKEQDIILFSELMKNSSCKLETVVYILAILELAKLGKIAIRQDGNDVVISKLCKPFSDDFLLGLESENSVKIRNSI